MPAFAECERTDGLAVTTELSERMLSLPMAADFEPDEIAAIGMMLRAAVDRT